MVVRWGEGEKERNREGARRSLDRVLKSHYPKTTVVVDDENDDDENDDDDDDDDECRPGCSRVSVKLFDE